MTEKELVEVEIESVKPYPQNPRLNEAAVAAVVKSIASFGFQAPILVDENMEILAGHTRLKAAHELKMRRVPVVITRGLSEEQKRAYRIADNKLSEIADWDPVLLREEIKFLHDKFKEEGLEFDLTAIGFSETELDLMLSQDDDFPDYLDEARETPESIKFTIIFEDVAQLVAFKQRFSFDKDKVTYDKFLQNCLNRNRPDEES